MENPATLHITCNGHLCRMVMPVHCAPHLNLQPRREETIFIFSHIHLHISLLKLVICSVMCLTLFHILLKACSSSKTRIISVFLFLSTSYTMGRYLTGLNTVFFKLEIILRQTICQHVLKLLHLNWYGNDVGIISKLFYS